VNTQIPVQILLKQSLYCNLLYIVALVDDGRVYEARTDVSVVPDGF
jgi:hypothetical protein